MVCLHWIYWRLPEEHLKSKMFFWRQPSALVADFSCKSLPCGAGDGYMVLNSEVHSASFAGAASVVRPKRCNTTWVLVAIPCCFSDVVTRIFTSYFKWIKSGRKEEYGDVKNQRGIEIMKEIWLLIFTSNSVDNRLPWNSTLLLRCR